MKVLQKIKSEDIIAIDIETVRIEQTYSELDEGTQSAWSYKNKQDGVVPSTEELSELWEKTASLYAEFSKVCAVSLAFLHNDVLYCKEFYGSNEHEILKNVGQTLDNIYSKGLTERRTFRLVGHASKFFDFPFLTKRFIINDMDIPTILDTTDAKPWEQTNMCTNELWRVGGTGAGSSLQALCNALMIPVSKVDLVGDEVGKAFYDKEYDKIGRYCSYDTVATFNVVRKLKKESFYKFENVKYVNVLKSDKKPKQENENPLVSLQTLYYSDHFGKDVKDKISKTISGKKILKKDKEFLQDLFENIYIRSEFMDTDSPDIVETKKAEIKDFIESLTKKTKK